MFIIKKMQYPTEIQQGMTLPTLGTIIPQTFNMDGVLPASMTNNYNNIMLQGVEGQTRALGFTTPMFQSTLEEYESSARAKDLSELQEQRSAGIDPKTSYFSFANTNSGPTNFNWSTTPMENLKLSTNTIPYQFDGASWTDQEPSRSEYRTRMGSEIMAQNTKLRSARLY